MSFTLPELTYDYAALEPHIDAQTMEIHHTKHHAAYTNNLNAALEGSGLESDSIEDLLAKVSTLSPAVRNNGGGFFNHNLFWVPSQEGKIRLGLCLDKMRLFNRYALHYKQFSEL